MAVRYSLVAFPEALGSAGALAVGITDAVTAEVVIALNFT